MEAFSRASVLWLFAAASLTAGKEERSAQLPECLPLGVRFLPCIDGSPQGLLLEASLAMILQMANHSS
jgi:hypothetical protein